MDQINTPYTPFGSLSSTPVDLQKDIGKWNTDKEAIGNITELEAGNIATSFVAGLRALINTKDGDSQAKVDAVVTMIKNYAAANKAALESGMNPEAAQKVMSAGMIGLGMALASSFSESDPRLLATICAGALDTLFALMQKPDFQKQLEHGTCRFFAQAVETEEGQPAKLALAAKVISNDAILDQLKSTKAVSEVLSSLGKK